MKDYRIGLIHGVLIGIAMGILIGRMLEAGV